MTLLSGARMNPNLTLTTACSRARPRSASRMSNSLCPNPVIVARVEERHPGVKRSLDCGDRLHLIRRAVGVGHPHAAQAER
jgi:hypothetical protein